MTSVSSNRTCTGCLPHQPPKQLAPQQQIHHRERQSAANMKTIISKGTTPNTPNTTPMLWARPESIEARSITARSNLSVVSRGITGPVVSRATAEGGGHCVKAIFSEYRKGAHSDLIHVRNSSVEYKICCRHCRANGPWPASWHPGVAARRKQLPPAVVRTGTQFCSHSHAS